MLKRLVIIAVAFVVTVAVVGFALPREMVVERSIHIDAPRPTVFTMLNGYQQFNRWSPWAERDPDAVYRLGGALWGVGARLDWQGDADTIGSGSQTIVASEPWHRIDVDLDFGEDGDARSWFILEPTEGGTDLTWGFTADLGTGLLERYYAVLMSYWIGGDYEAGLARLKPLAERLVGADFSSLEMTLTERSELRIAWLAIDSSPDPAAVSQALGEAYFRIMRFIGGLGASAAGAPMARIRSMNGRAKLDAAIPLPQELEIDAAGDERIRIGRTSAGPALKITHVGPYREMDMAHEAARAWLRAAGLRRAGDPWEVYVSDPASTRESALVTHIYYPVEPAVGPLRSP